MWRLLLAAALSYGNGSNCSVDLFIGAASAVLSRGAHAAGICWTKHGIGDLCPRCVSNTAIALECVTVVLLSAAYSYACLLQALVLLRRAQRARSRAHFS